MKRRGFTLVEAMVGAMLLAVAATICLQLLTLSTAAGRAADQRRLAAREAANIMERLMARPIDQLTPETIQGIELSKEATEALPEAQLAIRLDRQADDRPPATRLTLTLAWQGHGGRPAAPLRLVAWRYGDPARAVGLAQGATGVSPVPSAQETLARRQWHSNGAKEPKP